MSVFIFLSFRTKWNRNNEPTEYFFKLSNIEVTCVAWWTYPETTVSIRKWSINSEWGSRCFQMFQWRMQKFCFVVSIPLAESRMYFRSSDWKYQPFYLSNSATTHPKTASIPPSQEPSVVCKTRCAFKTFFFYYKDIYFPSILQIYLHVKQIT